MSHLSAPKLRSTQETPPAPSSSNKRYRSSESLCLNQKSVERSRSDVNNNNNETLTDHEPQQKKLKKGIPMTETGSYIEASKPAAYPIFGKLPNLNATPRHNQWEDIRDDPVRITFMSCTSVLFNIRFVFLNRKILFMTVLLHYAKLKLPLPPLGLPQKAKALQNR